MSGRIGRALRPVLDLIYPPFCVSCECLLPYAPTDSAPPLCPNCLRKWEDEKRTFCPICKKAHTDCSCGVPGMGGRVEEFLHLARYTDWESVARNVVLRAKDDAYVSLYDFLVSELAGLLRNRKIPVEKAIFTYIPRSLAKTRESGVDQGRKTAQMLAKRFGVPCVSTLKRGKAVEQKSLIATERRENAVKAFRLQKDVVPKVAGKTVILYDDVITSGASVSRAVDLLRSAGAGKIYVLTFAKTVRDPGQKQGTGSKTEESDDFDDDFSDFTLEDDG